MKSRRPSENFALPANIYAVRYLARDLLCRQVGERLATTADYQKEMRVGSGTVQNSLLHLTDTGAAQIDANGRRGTFLVEKNLSSLWSLGELGAVVGVFPLLVSGEWAGLATGLRVEFERIGIPLQTLHVHGSYLRMEMVSENKVDFAVLSTEAARRISETEYADDFVSMDLGTGTYYGPDSLIVMYRPGLNITSETHSTEHPSVRRIGIDRTAYDHAQLTQSEFPEEEGYTHVDVRYPYMPAAIVGGKLDAAVWNRQMLLLPLESVGIPVRPLREEASIVASRSMSSASLAYSGNLSKRPELTAVFDSLDHGKISRTQTRVREEQIMPSY